MIFISLYSVILGKEEHTTSKETNKAILIPESLDHQDTFPTIFLLNSGSFIVTLGRNGDQVHIDALLIYMPNSSTKRISTIGRKREIRSCGYMIEQQTYP